MNNTFIKVEEVAEILGISKSYAYKIVRQLNNELKEKGFLTISGRVNKTYFMERVYAPAERKD
ncbi:MAG: helix-turn-helix domain-containing protein [Ruminococcus sp.]|nr:helix-turn-helix domain-containing protein [Ruminococcus sp.]MCM1577575.1 helix-turn-helix domain-containing protein [Ruminococcus sp.]